MNSEGLRREKATERDRERLIGEEEKKDDIGRRGGDTFSVNSCHH